ncbi:type II secretion system protein [Candidatus Saccharibacteria bacterium]|nr:type II secretion system protein [Candidatus Saccharibacteria bacterium]
MSRIRRGFTLIEVALFLAVSGLLFVGVMAGMQGAISQQEKNDAVQNFAEFLRSAYSQAENVQNLTTGGNSEQAIYGKLITFGEKMGLARTSNDGREFFMYTVVGNIDNNVSAGSTLKAMQNLKANVVGVSGSQLQLLGISESYKMRWDTYLQRKCAVDSSGAVTCPTDSYEDFTGSILIVRHPNTGTVYTYYSPYVVEVNKTINDYGTGGETNPFKNSGATGFNTAGNNYLEANLFDNTSTIDFCINVSGRVDGNERVDVRLGEGASNASAIEIVGSERSVCEPRTP